MVNLVSLADVKTATTTKGPGFTPGQVYTVNDPTYGSCAFLYVKATEAVGVDGSPMYPVIASYDVAGEFLVSDDENGGGVTGQEICVGAWVSGVTTTANNYGFSQVRGLNVIPLTTDGNVVVNGGVVPTTTDGTWGTSSMTTPANDLHVGRALVDDSSTTSAAGTILFAVPGY